MVSGLKERVADWSPAPLVLSCHGEPLLIDAPFASLRSALAILSEGPLAANAFTALLESRLAHPDDVADPEQWRLRLGSAFVAWARSVAADRLLVIELDDLHWIDSGSVDLVTSLLGATDVACLLLATARPEIDERFPRLFAGLPSDRIDLRPLSAKAADRLVRSLLPSDEAAGIGDVVARAGGNPLFLRELSRVASVHGDARSLPTSLAFVIQLRIDALPATAREVCRVAATFGDRAWVEGVEFVLGRSCAADVLAIQRADIQRSVSSTLAGCTELAFRHALFRETAERMTLAADARAYHGRIFDWLKPRTKQGELLAYHAEKAGLGRAAAQLYAEAGRDASLVEQEPQAAAHLSRALDLGVEARMTPGELLPWLQQLDAALDKARSPVAVATLERVLAWVESVGTTEDRISARLAVASGMSATYQYARAGELFESVEQLGDVDEARVAAWLFQRVRHAVRRGRFAEGKDFLVRAEGRVPPERHFDFALMQVQVASALGDDAWSAAASDAARACMPDTALARYEFLKGQALVHHFRGDDARSASLSLEASEIAATAGLPYLQTVSLHNAGEMLLGLGQADQARDVLSRSTELATRYGLDVLRHYNQALLAFIDADRDALAASRSIESAGRFARAVGSSWAAIMLDLLLARTLAAGSPARARALAEQVQRESHEIGNARVGREAAELLARLDASPGAGATTGGGHSQMGAELLKTLRRGERWTPEQASEFLVAFHAARPGVTGRVVRDGRDADGLTSYELTAALVPRDAKVVLDLACGDGPLLVSLRGRLGAGVEWIGVDLSAVDLELARVHLDAPGVRLLRENAQALSLPDASVDAVVCHYALMLMRPLEAVLAEVARVLRPGGVFVACVPAGTSVDRNAEAPRELLLEVIRGDVPGYPDTGLGDLRVHDDGAIGELLRGAGFEGVSVGVRTVSCELAPASVVEQMRDYYWWDMIRGESRVRLERELPSLVERQAEPSGTIRQETRLKMVEARRRSSGSV